MVSATELGLGSYNTTFKLTLAAGGSVVARFAPREELQLRSERHWLRGQYAAGPWMHELGRLVPQVLGADFSHRLIERDVLIEEWLPGVPAPEILPGTPKERWPGFFAQLGDLSRRLHQVTNDRWGPAGQPESRSWAEELVRSLGDRAHDLRQLGALHQDVLELQGLVGARAGQLSIPRSSLLHGDLWTANVLLDPASPEPRVVGIVDHERAWWGDPLADWALFRADQRAVPAEKEAFWAAYGGRPSGQAEWRLLLYRGWHLAALRVEAARNGHQETVEDSVRQLAELLPTL